MLTCAIPGCSSTPQNCELSFFEIPSQTKLREKWIQVIGSLKRTRNVSSWIPNDRDVVCSKHFSLNDFRNTPKKKMLKPDALPSVFSNYCEELSPVYKKISRIDITRTPEHINIELVATCRLCGIKDGQMMGIFNNDGLEHNIPNLIEMYLPIKVEKNDHRISQSICYQCSSALISWHEIYQQTVYVDEQLKLLLDVNERTKIPKTPDSEARVSFSENEPNEKISNENFLTETVDDNEYLEDSYKNISDDMGKDHLDYSDVCSLGIKVEDEEKENSVKRSENQLNQSSIHDIAVDRSEICFPKPPPDAECKTFNYSVVRLYQCNICKCTVKTAYDFKKHMLSHKTINSYTCNVCGTSFALKKVMESHIRNAHSRRRKRDSENDKLCFQCNKNFTAKPSLHVHMHTKHWDGEFFVCDVCEATFSDIHDYKKHVKDNNHSTEGPIPKQCSTCGLDFDSRIRLKTHIAVKHGQGLKCSICGLVLHTYPEFQNHEALHPQLRPYKCEFCGKNFKRSTDYKKHQIIHTGERPHICEVCGKSFNRKHNMHMHRRSHFNEKPHACTICNQTFFRMGDLRKHKQLHYLKKSASHM